MEKGGVPLRARMRKANTRIGQGEARPCLYWVQNTGQSLGQTLRFWFLLPSRGLAVCPILRSPQLAPSALPAPSSPEERGNTSGKGYRLLLLWGSCHRLPFPTCWSLIDSCPVNIRALLGLGLGDSGPAEGL